MICCAISRSTPEKKYKTEADHIQNFCFFTDAQSKYLLLRDSDRFFLNSTSAGPWSAADTLLPGEPPEPYSESSDKPLSPDSR